MAPTAIPSACDLENPTYTTPTWISINYIVFLFVIFVVVKMCAVLLKRVDPKRWVAFSEEQRVNVISYLVQIIFSSAALCAQLVTVHVLDPNSGFDLFDLQVNRVAISIVCLLYCAELLFRRKMRLTLVIHHTTTIAISIFIISIFETTHDVNLSRMGVGFLYQATLEQATFAGLLLYRYRPKTWLTYYTLLVGAVVPLVLKLGSLGYVLVMWIKKILPQGTESPYYIAIDVILPTCCAILLFTQLWSANVVWKLALRSRPDRFSEHADGELGVDKIVSPLAPVPAPTSIRAPSPTHGLDRFRHASSESELTALNPDSRLSVAGSWDTSTARPLSGMISDSETLGESSGSVGGSPLVKPVRL